MKKEDLLGLIPTLSEEDAEALQNLWEEELLKGKESLEKVREEARSEALTLARAEYLEKQREEALEAALKQANSKSTKTLRALINTEAVGFSDGKLTGLDEQIEKLKTECGFLFFEEEEKPKFTKGPASFENKPDLSGLSYKERLKLYCEMPDVYQRLVK